MTDATASMELMHELLKSINGSLVKLEQRQYLTNEQLGSIEHHMAGIHTSVN